MTRDDYLDTLKIILTHKKGLEYLGTTLFNFNANTLEIFKVQEKFRVHEAIANWLGLDEHDIISKGLLDRFYENKSSERRYDFGHAFDRLREQLEVFFSEADLLVLYQKYHFYYTAIDKSGVMPNCAYQMGAEVSKNDLMMLANKLDEKPYFLFHNDEQNVRLDPRKEKSLYLIIASLMVSQGYSPDARDTVGRLKGKLQLAGVNMSDKIIREHTKEAFKVLEEKRD